MPETTSSKGRVAITQIASPARRPVEKRATLIGLGLNKLHRRSVLEDTPAVRGMIRKVWDLVQVEELPAGAAGDKVS